jgi:hypothetical protein
MRYVFFKFFLVPNLSFLMNEEAVLRYCAISEGPYGLDGHWIDKVRIDMKTMGTSFASSI